MQAGQPYTDFSVHVAPSDGGTNVAIFGELDMATLPAVERAVEEAMGATGPVVLDLRACVFVDSRGIALLVRTALRLQEEGRELRIRGVQERVTRILDLAGLSDSGLFVMEPPGAPQ